MFFCAFGWGNLVFLVWRWIISRRNCDGNDSELIGCGYFRYFDTSRDVEAGLDPASSAGILLTTVTDVVGFFAFLSLAKLIML